MSSESESQGVTAILCPPSRTAARKIRGFRDGFEEPLADRRDLVTERTGAKEGEIGPANRVVDTVRMGQPETGLLHHCRKSRNFKGLRIQTVTSQKHQAWDPPSRSARTVARRPNTEDPTRRSNPPRAVGVRRRRGWGSPGCGFLRLLADQIRQPRDFIQASYAILEILPEVDSQPPARLLQARKGVPRTPTRVTPRAAADLPLLDVVLDVPLAEVVVQRHLGALEHQQ